MTTYNVRFIVPKKAHDDWVAVEANSVVGAAQEFHYRRSADGLQITHEYAPGRRRVISFAKVEVEGHKPLVSRIYESRIWRRGGVKTGPSFQEKLVKIAEALDWPDRPEELLEEGWEEESTEWS